MDSVKDQKAPPSIKVDKKDQRDGSNSLDGTGERMPSIPTIQELPASSKEVIEYCVNRQRKTMWVDNDYDATLDREVLTDYVDIKTVPPKETGFPAWTRDGKARGSAEWLIPKDYQDQPGKPRVLYMHGGAFAWYSPESYRPFTSRLCEVLQMPVFVCDYRLVPEHKFPAAVEDGVAACHYVATHNLKGERAEGSPFYLIGDSAGGGLVYQSIVKLNDTEKGKGVLKGILGIVTLSPWTDFTASLESFKTNVWNPKTLKGDVQFSQGGKHETDRKSTIRMAHTYMGGECAIDVLKKHSPLFTKDVSFFPPNLIMVGEEELMKDESVHMFKRLKKDGVPAEIRVFPGMWHVWMWYTEGCGGENAKPCIEAISGFLCVAAFCKVKNNGRDSKFISKYKEFKKQS